MRAGTVARSRRARNNQDVRGASLAVLFFASVSVGCGGTPDAPSPPAARPVFTTVEGGAPRVPGDPTVGTTSCAQPPQCPTALPAAGSCCSAPGLTCLYPNGDPYATPAAVCIDDSSHPPFWQETLRVDRNRCTPGDASGAGPVGVDAGTFGVDAGAACEARPEAPCQSYGFDTPQVLLDGDLQRLVSECGGLPDESTVQVDFADGCATAILAEVSGPPSHGEAIAACLAPKLAATRFACAVGLSCAIVSQSTVQ
jgi:hypothetical protein